jgi:type VI secretion system protein ImpH
MGASAFRMGPMRFEQYLKFLPGQDAYHELVAWLKFYSNGSYETEVQLVLAREDAPPASWDRAEKRVRNWGW